MLVIINSMITTMSCVGKKMTMRKYNKVLCLCIILHVDFFFYCKIFLIFFNEHDYFNKIHI